MKKFWKLLAVIMGVALAGVLVSCGDADNDDNGGGYSISVAEADKTITLKPGAEKTINVTTNGNMVRPETVEGLTVDISNSSKTIKITASDSITVKTEKTVEVKLAEDSSQSVTIAVTVDPDAEVTYDKMTLTLNFAENIGASSVTVKYWDSSEENPDEGIIGSVEATVTNNTTTVELSSQYKGSWGYKISLVVKDSEGNNVDVRIAGNAYFEYEKDGTVTLAVKKYVATTKQMSIAFNNLGTVAAGTVTYGSSETDASLQTTVNMAITGTGATVDISSDYCNGDGYFYIAEIKIYSDEEKQKEIPGYETSFSAGTDNWLAFEPLPTVTLKIESDTPEQLPYTYNEFVAESNPLKVLNAATFSSLEKIGSVTITVSDIDWGEITDKWVSAYAPTAEDAWANSWSLTADSAGTTYTATILNEGGGATYISALTENGLAIAATNGAKGKITVSYEEYYLTVTSKTVVLSVGGDSKTITVSTNGTWEISTAATNTIATTSLENNVITITPAGAGETSFVISCKEKTDLKETISVNVSATSSSMSLVFNFPESVAKFDVTYGYDSTIKSETNLSVTNKTATVSVSSDYKNTSEWLAVSGLKAYNNSNETVSLSLSEAKSSLGEGTDYINSSSGWFKFGDNATVTYTYVEVGGAEINLTTSPYTTNYTGTGDLETLVGKDYFSELSSGSVSVSVSWVSGDNANVWFKVGDTDAALTWDNSVGTVSPTLESLKSGDLKIGATKDAVYSVTVTYTASE